jgi:hypothetical protein
MSYALGQLGWGQFSLWRNAVAGGRGRPAAPTPRSRFAAGSEWSDDHMVLGNRSGVLDELPAAVDPYASELGRMRADEHLPRRVRPREVKDDG